MSGILYFVPTPVGNLEEHDFQGDKSAERGRLYFVRRHANFRISAQTLRNFKAFEIVSSS